jgi:hypothetical protein
MLQSRLQQTSGKLPTDRLWLQALQNDQVACGRLQPPCRNASFKQASSVADNVEEVVPPRRLDLPSTVRNNFEEMRELGHKVTNARQHRIGPKADIGHSFIFQDCVQ